MSKLKRRLFFWVLLLSGSVSASEGPFTSDGAPWVRLSSSGSMTIYRMPDPVNCYQNKINVSNSEDPDMMEMAFSLVTAAQMSGKKINVWIDRYDSTIPQRCNLVFIEIDQ
ncbi:hypothetical protein [Microbulbifer variabilis]|uniref:hypothetical protein n=1 Tax=Microbulbifer variabilis TaxID=266805 RepID=UPI001CFD35A1|nr:hypothetical protein [Microbulbifer variabilis]